MKVILIKVDSKPELADVENTLKALQNAVSGNIETVTCGDIVFIVDEEGRYRGKKLNKVASQLYGDALFGDVVICGVKGDEFADVPARLIKFVK